MPLVLEKVLVTGGSGMVGRYVSFGMRSSRDELDLLAPEEEIAAFVRDRRPAAVLHLAAQTDMRYCEEHSEEAERINADGTRKLARAAAKVGACFVYLSTNAVFDGAKAAPYDEDDIPAPVNEYGKSKRAGEEAVKKHSREWLIVRTGWVFGGGRAGDKRFVGKITAKLGEPEIRAVSDNSGTPTYAKDLVEKVAELMQEGRTGIVHVTNSGTASRFAQAKFIADFFGYRGRVVPVSLADYPLIPAPLRNEALVSKFVHLRPWQDALREYLTTEWN